MTDGPAQRGKKGKRLSPQGPKGLKGNEHDARRATALRENLGKRKSQIRVRRGRGAS